MLRRAAARASSWTRASARRGFASKSDGPGDASTSSVARSSSSNAPPAPASSSSSSSSSNAAAREAAAAPEASPEELIRAGKPLNLSQSAELLFDDATPRARGGRRADGTFTLDWHLWHAFLAALPAAAALAYAQHVKTTDGWKKHEEKLRGAGGDAGGALRALAGGGGGGGEGGGDASSLSSSSSSSNDDDLRRTVASLQRQVQELASRIAGDGDAGVAA